MKKYLNKIGIFLLAMIILIQLNGTTAYAAENIDTEDEGYVIGYIMPSPSTCSFNEDGVVSGDGVRLRREPNFDSTIIELMYFGEMVKIDLDNSTTTFYYVERVKTGTKGYANAEYIQIVEYVK